MKDSWAEKPTSRNLEVPLLLWFPIHNDRDVTGGCVWKTSFKQVALSEGPIVKAPIRANTRLALERYIARATCTLFFPDHRCDYTLPLHVLHHTRFRGDVGSGLHQESFEVESDYFFLVTLSLCFIFVSSCCSTPHDGRKANRVRTTFEQNCIS